MNWVNTYVDDYYKWLREKTFIQTESNSDWFLISTPFLGAFNDSIEIYARKEENRLTLSDNGETLANLELQGLHIQGSKKRRDLLDSILINYGLKYSNNEIYVETDLKNFSQTKHNFLQAIVEINDLYVLSKNNVASIFKEDVRNYLDSQDIVYTPDFISKGVTGLEFNFDFQIARKNKEVVIKSYNMVNKQNISTFLFSWEDIKPVREKTTKKELSAIAIINDSEKPVKNEYTDALQSKNANYILWSQRNTQASKDLLVA